MQVDWLLRLALPHGLLLASSVVLAVAQQCVPPWTERTGRTAWHPHRVAERYGPFTLILLGEGVLAAITAVQLGVGQGGLTASSAAVSAAGLLLVFGLWWLYFLRPTGEAGCSAGGTGTT